MLIFREVNKYAIENLQKWLYNPPHPACCKLINEELFMPEFKESRHPKRFAFNEYREKTNKIPKDYVPQIFPRFTKLKYPHRESLYKLRSFSIQNENTHIYFIKVTWIASIIVNMVIIGFIINKLSYERRCFFVHQEMSQQFTRTDVLELESRRKTETQVRDNFRRYPWWDSWFH